MSATNAAAELAKLKEELLQLNELFRAACQIADNARRENATLKARLTKANELSAPRLSDAIQKALNKGLQPNAGDLIADMVEANKRRRAREGMTRAERTEDSLRKLRELKS